ncbi:MAG: type II toxin-antitoxin system CcdA family antitoxin [Ilumatobacteraceae bacterium]
MARLNVYVPDELADAARSAELNVSAITQAALRTALGANSIDHWLDSLDSLEPVSVSGAQAERALDEARDELWGDD